MPHNLLSARKRLAVICNNLAQPLVELGLLVGRLTSWLVLLVMSAVLITVMMNYLGINILARWDEKILLFGRGITINSITELQWHIFGVLTLFGATYALHLDSHVRVDVVYHNLSLRNRALINIVGHSVMLIPFCLIISWLSKSFVQMAYISGEQSNYGGLTDRYLIKAMLPIGMGFLALGALGQIIKSISVVLDPSIYRDPPSN